MEQAERTGEPEAESGNEPEESTPGVQCETVLENQKKEIAELNDRYLRLAADFENYRRRTARDREQSVALANEHFGADVLEIVDNLERAEKADDAHLREGLVQIRQLLASILQRHGIEPIDSLSKKFDPNEHEAIAHVSSDREPGTVIDVVSRGYRMHGKIIRYAKVAVAKKNEG